MITQQQIHYLSLPIHSEERQNAFDEHLKNIEIEGKFAYRNNASETDNPYLNTKEPHEGRAWHYGWILEALGIDN